MSQEIRFGDFIGETRANQRSIDYNDLIPKPVFDADRKEIPHKISKLRLRPLDIHRLLTPYLTVRLLDQIKAVVPLALYLVLFQILILRQSVLDHWIITGGLLAVIIGLMIFMEGLKLGLMPFGETIGHSLPRKSPLPVVLTITFLLGIGVTFAEPAIGALKTVGAMVDVEKAPYLYTMLNDWADTLVLVVGIGVGFASALGTLRFLYGWSLKPLIYFTLIPTIGLSLYCMMDVELSKILGLAWDCGAVTTGPITVPLVLALGIGIASAAGKGSSSLSGFGVVTLASLFPIIGVLSLSIFVSLQVEPEIIIQTAKSAALVASTIPWHQQSPVQEIISGFRAIVPLVLFLFIILKFLLKEKVPDVGIVTYGLILSLLGMIIFSLGLTSGLAKLGGQSGGLVPAAFTSLTGVQSSPLFDYQTGVTIALFFAWALGFGATLAEPALNALGQTVETLTNGVFKKKMLMYAVSIGVGFGIALGILKIIFNLPIGWILIPGYLLATILTVVSSEEYVNIAWDSAGVTTGPVTVPLVLGMGLGFGNAVDSIDGFGILSMASICPILSVLITGIWVNMKMKRQELEEELSLEPETQGATVV
jgi:hypothetical protein